MYFHFRIKNNFFRIIYTLLIISATLDSFAQAISKNKQPNKDKLKSAIQSQPILFLENQGQMTDLDGKPVPFVLFRADAPGLNLYITSNGLTYTFIKAEEKKQIDIEVKDEHKKDEIVSFGWERVDMELKGAIIKRENIVKKEESENSFNYFLGHCPNGIYGVKKYQKIIIEEVYPGIDWVLYNSSEKGFKYDFIVHPGADYRNIQLQYSSRQSIFLNENGELEIETEDGKLTESKPISYYKGNTIQTNFSVTSKELINIKGEIGIVTNIAFSFPNNELTYLTSDLIIDPTLFWATFIGAGPSLDGPFSVTSDASGNAFITGYTSSMNFPTQNSGTFFQGINGGPRDVFISKFNSACNMVWSTYYGGSFSDNSSFITTDVNGNIFITGETGSANFPLQNAGTYFQSVYNGGEAFILKFSNSGIRLWATLYGGTGSDGADCITLDATGNVFITGRTTSTDFPLQNAGTFFQSSNLGYSDAFIVKFDNFGNRLWATYYGGNSTDIGHCITADLNGNIFITGHTISTNFPLQNAGTYFQPTYGGGYGDAFIIKFTNQGTRLWSTYYGGSTDDRGFSIMSDASGNVFVGGSTNSVDFSTQNGGTFFHH